MTSCKEYPFTIHIEILLMMTQLNKVFAIFILFSTAVREIEDLIYNWKALGNQQGLFVFYEKNCIVVVIIRDKTKRIVLNISITVNKVGVVHKFFYFNGNFGFYLAQGTDNFQ